jgi:hypothetical protein
MDPYRCAITQTKQHLSGETTRALDMLQLVRSEQSRNIAKNQSTAEPTFLSPTWRIRKHHFKLPATQFDRDLGACLQYMVEMDGSDVFLTAGAVPTVKIEGAMRPMPVPGPALAPGRAEERAYSMMIELRMRQFDADLECDLAVGIEPLGRCRQNVYAQRSRVGIVVRYVKNEIPSVTNLRMSAVLQKLAMLKRGLVLVPGAVGSGKSVTLGALLDHRNAEAPGHILTIEDPIEFLHQHKKCVVDQPEVGLDTRSFDEPIVSGTRSLKQDALEKAFGGSIDLRQAATVDRGMGHTACPLWKASTPDRRTKPQDHR